MAKAYLTEDEIIFGLKHGVIKKGEKKHTRQTRREAVLETSISRFLLDQGIESGNIGVYLTGRKDHAFNVRSHVFVSLEDVIDYMNYANESKVRRGLRPLKAFKKYY